MKPDLKKRLAEIDHYFAAKLLFLIHVMAKKFYSFLSSRIPEYTDQITIRIEDHFIFFVSLGF